MAETRHVQTFVLVMFLVGDTQHLEFGFFLGFRGWGSSAQPQVWGLWHVAVPAFAAND